LISSAKDWLYKIDLEKDYWPTSESEISKFIEGLQIVKSRDFNDTKYLFSFDFSRNFIKDIIKENNNRGKIFRQIVSKLTKTRESSGKDTSLHDEYIKERKEFRFRITAAARIHYEYENGNHITFLKYYDPSEHENGLKKQ